MARVVRLELTTPRFSVVVQIARTPRRDAEFARDRRDLIHRLIQFARSFDDAGFQVNPFCAIMGSWMIASIE